MPQKTNNDDSYEKFSASVKSGQFGCFYIFHGDERYLLENSLAEIRRRLCPGGLDGFNYKRFEGKDIKANELEDAINTLPIYADRTLIEINDLDIFKGKKKSDQEADDTANPVPAKNAKGDENKDKRRFSGIFSDLPDYVCVVVVYDTIPFKPDNRQKLDKEILARAQIVEFTVQSQSKLTNWINRRFMAVGKNITKTDAEYLALITDGYMAALAGEIEKVSAYSDGETVTRADIDAVVTPVLNAIAYKLTDAILESSYSKALSILDELFLMHEPAQKIIYSVSQKMRQLLAARVCIETRSGKKALMDMCGIRFDFQADTLMNTARKATLTRCRDAVLLCAKTAYDLNSAPEPEARLVELLTQLALTA